MTLRLMHLMVGQICRFMFVVAGGFSSLYVKVNRLLQFFSCLSLQALCGKSAAVFMAFEYCV